MDTPVFLLFLSISSILGQNTQDSSVSAQLPQCQCIPDSTGTGCIQYDSRFQATTLDEAMTSFPDLTLERNETSPDPTLESQAACTTQECLDCDSDLNYRLKKIGLIPLQIGEILPATGNLSSSCKKYKFSGHDEGIYDKDEEERHANSYTLGTSDSEDSDEEEKPKKKNQKKKKGDRKKRQAGATNLPSVGNLITIIGQRYTLSCSAKGVATDSTGFVSLCSMCWVWRQLPSNYSPQYINELICDQSDGSCLSGFASCGLGHRSVDVVQTIGNTKTTVSISAGSFCECKVAKSSTLMSLVTGNGTTGLLPSIPGLG